MAIIRNDTSSPVHRQRTSVGGPVIFVTLLPSSESNEIVDVAEEMEEAGDRTRGGVAGVRTSAVTTTDRHACEEHVSNRPRR